MPIDFHDDDNSFTYASREADSSWLGAMTELTEPQDKTVYDIACGGGIYTRAWSKLGAAQVVGVDFSEPNLRVAELQTSDPKISYLQADALATHLPDASADLVFARALIHHIEDLPALFGEAARLLKPGGQYLLQGRSHADVREAASPQHLRGYLLELFPRLLAVETARRHSVAEIKTRLKQARFENVSSTTLWERRKHYTDFEELALELRNRVGASILHELSDGELEQLISHLHDVLGKSVLGESPISVQDPWTLWLAQK